MRLIPLKKTWTFAVFFITVSLCASDRILPQPVGRLQQSVAGFIDTIMMKYSVPGATVGIWRHDSVIVLLTKGIADIDQGRAVNRKDQVRIGSITKTFVVSVFLELVDEKKVSLTDTLKKFLPSIPKADRILLVQLCNHTSGIHDILEDSLNQNNFVVKPRYHWSRQELLDTISHTRPDFEPGTRFSYSNTGYLVLGLVIEKVSGHSIESEISARLLKPLKLFATAFPADSLFTTRFLRGYMLDETTKKLKDVSCISPSLVWTAGAMISTLDDLKKWSRLLYKGEFLKPQTRQNRLAFTQGWNEYSRYGLGIMKVGRWIGHSGGIYGYNTGMCYEPESGITVVVLLNNCNQVDGHMTEVMKGFSRILFGE